METVPRSEEALAPARPEHLRKTERGEAVTFLEAVSEALWEEMARDPEVFLLGEDIGPYGGAFKVTQGFQAAFGPLRVIDTPISEVGFTGAAAGAAHMGLRPVVEIQFMDFITPAVDVIMMRAISSPAYRRVRKLDTATTAKPAPTERALNTIALPEVKRAARVVCS